MITWSLKPRAYTVSSWDEFIVFTDKIFCSGNELDRISQFIAHSSKTSNPQWQKHFPVSYSTFTPALCCKIVRLAWWHIMLEQYKPASITIHFTAMSIHFTAMAKESTMFLAGLDKCSPSVQLCACLLGNKSCYVQLGGPAKL